MGWALYQGFFALVIASCIAELMYLAHLETDLRAARRNIEASADARLRGDLDEAWRCIDSAEALNQSNARRLHAPVFLRLFRAENWRNLTESSEGR